MLSNIVVMVGFEPTLDFYCRTVFNRLLYFPCGDNVYQFHHTTSVNIRKDYYNKY